MAKQNLFNILKDSPWWMSAVIAVAVFMGTRMLLPDFGAAFAALPFGVIAVYAGWRQWNVPSAAKMANALDKLRAMSWEEFSALMAEAFRRDGYDVATLSLAGADFELRKGGRVAVASCRRWKAAQGGTGPLKELLGAMKKAGANDCVFVTAGELSPNARDFALDCAIQVLGNAELVRLVNRVRRS